MAQLSLRKIRSSRYPPSLSSLRSYLLNSILPHFFHFTDLKYLSCLPLFIFSLLVYCLLQISAFSTLFLASIETSVLGKIQLPAGSSFTLSYLISPISIHFLSLSLSCSFALFPLPYLVMKIYYYYRSAFGVSEKLYSTTQAIGNSCGICDR